MRVSTVKGPDQPADLEPEWMSAHGSVLAYFRPRRTDNLKPDAVAMIGREGVFEALWVIEPEHEYAGEWAMRFPRDWLSDTTPFVWVPIGDLEIVERYALSPDQPADL